MPTYAFNARETPDVASLQVTDDLNLRCYVWAVSEDAGGAQTIESEIRRVEDDGEEVVVWRGRVRAPADPSHVCDSPKVVGVLDDDGPDARQVFIVHWLEGERTSSPALYHSFLDPTQPDWEWQDTASTSTSTAWLYDVVPVVGEVGFVVVHRESGTAFTTMRFET